MLRISLKTSQNVKVSRSHFLIIKGEVIKFVNNCSKKMCNKPLNTDNGRLTMVTCPMRITVTATIIWAFPCENKAYGQNIKKKSFLYAWKLLITMRHPAKFYWETTTLSTSKMHSKSIYWSYVFQRKSWNQVSSFLCCISKWQKDR